MRDTNEFFIGYDDAVPPSLGRFVTRVAAVVVFGAAAAGALLAAGHSRLDGGLFDFGHPRAAHGLLTGQPYPALVEDGVSRRATLLVAPGKHGASRLIEGLDGHHVTLEGTRIERGAATLLEVLPDSIRGGAERGHAVAPTSTEGAPVTLRGEIVDSKCFLGVMVPGSGTTHRECASLCLRGGIPPAFFVQDRSNRSALLLLLGPSQAEVQSRAVALAGGVVEITGRVRRQAGWLVLESIPATWRPGE